MLFFIIPMIAFCPPAEVVDVSTQSTVVTAHSRAINVRVWGQWLLQLPCNAVSCLSMLSKSHSKHKIPNPANDDKWRELWQQIAYYTWYFNMSLQDQCSAHDTEHDPRLQSLHRKGAHVGNDTHPLTCVAASVGSSPLSQRGAMLVGCG